MTALTNPLDSIVYIKSLVSQTTSGGVTTSLYQTGSGVLISPDEILTAAHVVYGPAGTVLTNTQVAPGYNNNNAPNGVYAEAGVHVNNAYVPSLTGTEYLDATGVGLDYALIHLATPITNVPIFQLGANFTGGSLILTGYPAGTSGYQNSLSTSATQLSGVNILQADGQPGNGGDPHGASGGPAWTMVNGVPTVVGVIDTASGSNTALNQLTSAEIQQILGWVSQDDAGKAWASPTVVDPNTGVSQPGAGGQPSVAAAAAAPSLSPSDLLHLVADPIIAAITNDASQSGHPALTASAIHAASALQSNIDSVGSAKFDDLVDAAFGKVEDGSALGSRTGAYLEGLKIGHDGGSSVGLFTKIVNAVGSIFGGGTGGKAAALAGFQEGKALQAYQSTAGQFTTAAQTVADVIDAYGAGSYAMRNGGSGIAMPPHDYR